MSVITAFEFHNVLAIRVRAREANRGHRCFRARADEADLLDRWHRLDDEFSKFGLKRSGSAEAGAVAGSNGDRFHHRRKRVTEDERSPRADIVDVLIGVGVPKIRTDSA